MKKKLLALLMGTSIVLAACGGGSGEEASDDSATASGGDAEKLYGQKCSACHGTNLEGGVGPKLETIGASLSKEDIEKVILEGQGAMPKGLLEGEDASSVAEWLAGKK
jgi:cytochrome c551